MAYINRKSVEDAIRKYADTKHCNGEQIEYVNGILKSISVIKEHPSADVVGVVRCKNCRHCEDYDERDEYGWYHCAMHDMPTKLDNFCNFGERSDSE